MSACPSLALDDQTIASALGVVDCQLNGAVAASYRQLFAAGGAFAAVLTALLTVFVAVIAYGLITGRTWLTLSAMTPKAITFVLVLTFATAWPAYQAVVYGLLTGGPDQVAAVLTGAPDGAAQAFARRLDGLFGSVADIGRQIDAAKGEDAARGQASKLVWTSAIVLLMSTLGLLVISRVVLALLLAIGPVFMVLALFGPTRSLFEGWLKVSLAFAFAPMLIVVGGVGALNLIAPLIAAIVEDPMAAARDSQPLIVLFVASLIYAGILVALGWAAFSITRGFQLPLFASTAWAAKEPSAAPEAVSPAGARDRESAGRSPNLDVRLASMVAAMGREIAPPLVPANDVARVVLRSDGAPASSNSPAAGRTEGLGQRFRYTAAARPLTGAPGS